MASPSTLQDNGQPLFKIKKERLKKYLECMPGRAPKKGTAEFEFLQKFCLRVEVILQTVNDNEYQAATTVMEKPDDMFDRAVVFPKGGMVLGMFAERRTALIQTSMGDNAGDFIADAIDTFPNAVYVIGVGVCYSFDPSKYQLGDVLVSEQISTLANPKVDCQVVNRGETINVVQDLRRIFCLNKFHEFVVSTQHSSEVSSGNIISYPLLINNKKIRDKLLKAIPTAIGGEMEGGQLLQFQQKRKVKGIIIIKGVCDYADGNKKDEWQFISALAALNYTKYKLQYEPSLIDEEPPLQASALTAQPLSPAAESKPDAVEYMGIDAPRINHLVTALFNKATGKRFNLADRISNCWNIIGLRLGIEHAALDSINRDNRKDSERLQEVFILWLENAAKLHPDRYPLSWQGLKTLLEDCQKTEVAKEYFEFIDTPDVVIL